jgi:hypothetical protein
MIGIFFSKRKKVEAVQTQPQTTPISSELRRQEERAAPFMGGVAEKTQELQGRHDGERIGFRKPVG